MSGHSLPSSSSITVEHAHGALDWVIRENNFSTFPLQSVRSNLPNGLQWMDTQHFVTFQDVNRTCMSTETYLHSRHMPCVAHSKVNKATPRWSQNLDKSETDTLSWFMFIELVGSISSNPIEICGSLLTAAVHKSVFGYLITRLEWAGTAN
jgi:hypothetical protein